MISKLAIILTLLLLAACHQQPASKPAAQPAANANWKMALTTVPDPPLNEKPTVFRLHLTDETGRPISGAQVKAALDMLTMDMGKNEITFADKGDGNYEGTGKFTMAGPWNVVVTAEQGYTIAQQKFSMGVRL